METLTFTPSIIVFVSMQYVSRFQSRSCFVQNKTPSRIDWLNSVPIKTNNDCEGWHNRFKNIVDKHRPNIWRLLNSLLQEQSATEIMKQQILAGHVVTSRNRIYKKIHRRLERLLRRYRRGHLTLTNYITGVSYNLARFNWIKNN